MDPASVIAPAVPAAPPSGTGGNDPLAILAHELRQPLYTIAMATENARLLMEQGAPDRERVRHALERIAEQVDRTQALITATLTSANPRQQAVVSTDLVEAARNAVTLAKLLPIAAHVDIAWQLPEESMCVGLAMLQLEQVFINILRNGMESIADRRKQGWQERGLIRITIQPSARDVRCTVIDNGVGISSADTKDLFEPYFTTKGANGNGLGLHICRLILGKADGGIRLSPGEVEGARVELWVPRVHQEAAS